MVDGLKKSFSKIFVNYNLDKLLVNSGSVFLRRIVGLILTFFWIFLITNLFGAETYGLVSLGQVIISFSAMVFGLGIPTLLVKLGASNEHYENGIVKTDFFKKSLVIITISSIICCALIFFLREPLALKLFKKEDFKDYLTIISPLFLLFLFS